MSYLCDIYHDGWGKASTYYKNSVSLSVRVRKFKGAAKVVKTPVLTHSTLSSSDECFL